MDNNKSLEIIAGLKILKPASIVFNAIIDPAHMSQYFIAKGSGSMEEGKTITWQFPEMDMTFPVRVGKMEQDQYISFSWDDMDGTPLLVEMFLKPLDGATLITITEKARENNEEGINWLKRNTEGWANFLACLKAYLEYGINLRRGAFDISQMPEKN